MYADAIGDSEAVAEQLRMCFTDDAVAVFELPPAWDHVNIIKTGGPQAFGPFAVQLYHSFGWRHSQLMVGKVVVQKTGAPPRP